MFTIKESVEKTKGLEKEKKFGVVLTVTEYIQYEEHIEQFSLVDVSQVVLRKNILKLIDKFRNDTKEFLDENGII